MVKIMLLEDDITLQEIISESLVEEGYEVTCCSDGLEATSMIYENHFDVLLLDVMVPNMSGFEALKYIRDSGDMTPAIFITSLQSIEDLEVGFNSGCDDYIKKPFEIKELLLRIQCILKRTNSSCVVDFHNGYSFDMSDGILYLNGNAQKMPLKERELLKLLLQHKQHFVSLNDIYETLWGDDEPSELSLRVYIKNLRQIVGKERIVTYRGEGYCYSNE